MNTRQLLDKVDLGMVIVDKKFRVLEWNNWMALHTGIEREKILHTNLFSSFPNLNTQSFLRSFKSVITFGNIMYFSQKLHKYLFPCKLMGVFAAEFDFMQQRCTMAAIQNGTSKFESVLITVQDITENVALEKHLREMNLIDPLTKVYNRRYLDKRLKEEFSRHQRLDSSLSLLMIDLDYFKKVNDTYGHSCGDIILREISKILLQLLRGTDIFARFGGEEFCCILPDTDIKSACRIAERLRETVADSKISCSNISSSISLTISIGAAEASKEHTQPKELLDQADQALYQAKKSGRNRVLC